MKKIKNAILALVTILSVAPSVVAQNSLLYKVEGENIKTSYVFGTVHMLPKEDFLLEEKVKTAFSARLPFVQRCFQNSPYLGLNGLS